MKVLIALLSMLVLFSCNKEGCTDMSATNTVSGAKKDDGSCIFEASLVFWHTASTRSILNGAGVTELTYILDGTTLGSAAIDNVFETAPSCNQTDAFHRDIAYDVESEKALSYSISDQNGTIHFTGNVLVTGNSCVPVELHF